MPSAQKGDCSGITDGYSECNLHLHFGRGHRGSTGISTKLQHFPDGICVMDLVMRALVQVNKRVEEVKMQVSSDKCEFFKETKTHLQISENTWGEILQQF